MANKKKMANGAQKSKSPVKGKMPTAKNNKNLKTTSVRTKPAVRNYSDCPPYYNGYGDYGYGGQPRSYASNDHYRLPEDKKPGKQRDYFFVMRKSVCFIMFLLLLVTVALFVLSYLNIEAIPKEYISLATEQTVSEEEEADTGAEYSILDPIFGTIKHLTGKFMDSPITLGESPLYDKMVAKAEITQDKVQAILMTYAPLLLIMYIIIAVVMMFKAFFGIFGKRIFKQFVLGSFLMLVSGAAMAFALLAFTTEAGSKMAMGGIVTILIGSFQSAQGLLGGYGMLALIGLPLITLILGMFAKKKVPYSIFDV